MNLSHKWIVGAAPSSLLLAGCVSKVTETDQYSGFLKDYDGLQETTTIRAMTSDLQAVLK